MSDENQQAAQDGGDGGENDWLVSYADMMTLIACFFILMMAFANYDPVGFNKKAKELSKSFNEGKYKSSEIKLSELSEEISQHPELKKKAKITVQDSDIIITFSGSVLFQEGSFNLKKDIIPSLDILIDIIRTRDPNYRVIIEGHTDPFEYKSVSALSSSWELGALRSAKVLARFEYFGFNPKKLVAVTKGDSEPIAENVDDNGKILTENLIENRRVVIKVIEPKEKQEKVKFGFGILLDE